MPEKEFRGQPGVCWFRTLHESWLHSYIISPSGRDRSEGSQAAEILFPEPASGLRGSVPAGADLPTRPGLGGVRSQ